MRRYLALASILAAGPVQAQAETGMPAWMAGAWCTEGPKTDRRCEYWTPDSGGLMIGASIKTEGGKAVSFEQMRIVVLDQGIAFIASPDGAPAVVFRGIDSGGERVIFANSDHDYPQRIRYWIKEETLNAEVSLADGSKPLRWTFKRSR